MYFPIRVILVTLWWFSLFVFFITRMYILFIAIINMQSFYVYKDVNSLKVAIILPEELW